MHALVGVDAMSIPSSFGHLAQANAFSDLWLVRLDLQEQGRLGDAPQDKIVAVLKQVYCGYKILDGIDLPPYLLLLISYKRTDRCLTVPVRFAGQPE
jgi:hypothetical protein